MEKVIGIISYLPDDESISANMKEKARKALYRSMSLYAP